ncbi:MAG: class I SAM-dependent methyltransferase [Dehalococcoidales bacterium]|nr:class I SAM-dependent methyltransferase [Dehalococcoidales bacterium]
MSRNKTNMYDVDAHIAEIYDAQQNNTDDIILLKKLIGERRSLNILEPFCGTGRIFFPLAEDGHTITGLDQAKGLLDAAARKVPEGFGDRITLQHADVLEGGWPRGFDLVILGGNCFYELATPEEQESCIRYAAESLKSGGYVYVDNDHMEGELASSWTTPGITEAFPTGKCADGTDIKSFWEVVWYDMQNRLARFRRKTEVTYPDGTTTSTEYIQQKHPVSMPEVRGWLEGNGFVVENIFGDREGNQYSESSPRAIFWAVKK